MIDRRQFLGRSGGLLVALAVPLPAACARTKRGEIIPGTLTAYLGIANDGTVTLFSPTTEMGQGTHTGHAAIIADELDVLLENVRVQTAEPADPFRWKGEMYSGGSYGISVWHEPLRKAAAQARAMLLAAAAAKMGVSRDELDTDAGAVLHQTSGRRVDYASLSAAASELEPPGDPPLRDPAKYRYRGRSVPRLDIPPLVHGKGVFASDIERPGMVYACARLSPVFGAEVESLDPGPALEVTGVTQVVEIPGGAAVVASNSWAAMRGAEALRIRFRATPHATLNSSMISNHLRAGLDADDRAIEAKNVGDVARAFVAAARSFEAVYEVPYLAHAPMEPWTCTLELDQDGILHLWAPSQAQDLYRRVAAESAGMPVHRVRIHTPQVGGGFGRRLDADGVPGAVRTAMAVRKPVKFFWRREDDIAQGRYRPAQAARLRAAIDHHGKLTALAIRTSGPPLDPSMPEGKLDFWSAVYGLLDFRYRLDSVRVDWVRVDHPVPVTTWRSIGATQNAYFLECFLDELARELDMDPYRLRRELLAGDSRALEVIDTAAEAAGWSGPAPPGRARGMAFFESYGSLCAQVAEVSLQGHKPVIHRIVCALDCGSIILPDAVRAQVEGAIVMGISAAMDERIDIADGGAVNTNFDRYRLLRMLDAPRKIDTVIIESGEPIGAVGLPPLPPAAPAVLNALLALTGRPVNTLPLS